MSVLTLPVPWKNDGEIGFEGVVEIHSSDLPRQKFEGCHLGDLIAVLNRKLRDQPHEGSDIGNVKSIQLYGSRIGDDCLLEWLIPELTSSAPRIVATVRVEPKATKGESLVVFVKSLTGMTVIVKCNSEDTVDSIKAQIRDATHISVDDQRIMYGGKQLENHRNLSFYKNS